MRTSRLGVLICLVVTLCGGVPAKGIAGFSPYDPGRQQTLETIPDTDPIPYLAALDHLRVGDTRPALEWSRRAVRDFPFHRPSFTTHFQLVSEVHGDSFARKWARDHLKRTRYPELLNGLITSENVTEATLESLLAWALGEGFSTTESLRFLGSRVFANASDDRLITAFETALETSDETPARLYLRARMLAEHGDCERAIDLVERLVKRSPGEARGQLLKARLLQDEQSGAASVAYERYRSLLSDTATIEPLGAREYSCRRTGK